MTAEPQPPASETETPAAPTPERRHMLVSTLAACAAGALLLDIISKQLVVAKLTDHPDVTVIPHVLDLQLTRNSGAAFSLGTGSTVIFTVIAAIVAVVIVRTAPRLVSVAWSVVLGLLLGGALGNLADRLFRAPGFGRGEVIDWIHLHHWPYFNIADSAITIGGVLAVVLSFMNKPATAPRRTDA